MIRRLRPGRRPPLPRPGIALLGALTVVVILGTTVVYPVSRSAAQEMDPFDIEVSKRTDLTSGEAIEVLVTTHEGTTFSGGASGVWICPTVDSSHEFTQDEVRGVGAFGTLCPPGHIPISTVDESVDSRQLNLFPDLRHGYTVLRPGAGTGRWPSGGQREITCGAEDPCRLVFVLDLTVNGEATTYVRDWSELTYLPTEGVTGCEGSEPNRVSTGMTDRLREAWIGWTQDVCQTDDVPPPTSSIFQREDQALQAFAAGTADVAYSAVGYREGFDAPVRRPLVPTPVALNAVVVAVGGGYQVDDGSWPINLPKRHEQFRLTTDDVARMFGPSLAALGSADLEAHYAGVLANNPNITVVSDLSNQNTDASTPLALAGPQSTTLFASTFLDAVAPAAWVDNARNDRGVYVDFSGRRTIPNPDPEAPNPTLEVPEFPGLGLKATRSDLGRTGYRFTANLELGTFYMLTDLVTAQALGLTVATVILPDGREVTPSATTLAEAVQEMIEHEDGTLLPNPEATSGYPLTFVEYAMAPAEPLVGANCVPRVGSQEVLGDWLQYVTTSGQELLEEPGGLAPLTPGLRTAAAEARTRVGASGSTCVPTPASTTTSTTGAPATNPAASTPGGSSGPGGTGSPTGPGGVDAPGAVQEATPETAEEALEAANEADVSLPDLLGIRAVNDLAPPAALLLIVAMTTAVALATAGYPLPAGVANLPRRVRALRIRRGGGRGGGSAATPPVPGAAEAPAAEAVELGAVAAAADGGLPA